MAAPRGWQWRPLVQLARLQSGHTPQSSASRVLGWHRAVDQHPECQGSPRQADHRHRRDDKRVGHCELIRWRTSLQTVCLSRTASVGYVVVTARPMATSQDFVNWICGDELEPEFLQYLFLAEGDDLLRFSSSAVHQTIDFPEEGQGVPCLRSRASRATPHRHHPRRSLRGHRHRQGQRRKRTCRTHMRSSRATSRPCTPCGSAIYQWSGLRNCANGIG